MKVLRVQSSVGSKDVLMRLFFHRSVVTVRNWMLFGIFLYSAFGILDIYYMPIHLELTWFIRFGIVVPLLFIFYGITFSKSLKDYLPLILACFVTTAIIGINALSAIADPQEKGYHFWFVGLFLAMFWLHNAGLNTKTLWIQHAIAIVGYNIAAIAFQKLHIQSMEVLIGNNCMILTAILLSIISSRIVESFIKEDQTTKRELEQAIILKEKILSVISHDIRGPVASIKGLLNLCAHGGITREELQSNARMLTESVDSLQGLLDSIFIWTMGGDGNFPIQKTNLSLYGVVEDSIKLFAPLSERKSIALHNLVDPSVIISADPVILNLIIRNLVSNAFRFTEEGAITVKANQTPVFTYIYVEGSGSVVDDEMVELLLKGIGSTSSATHDGKGFGLAICKELVERHGGSFTFFTRKGNRMIMYFTLPNSMLKSNGTVQHESMENYSKVAE